MCIVHCVYDGVVSKMRREKTDEKLLRTELNKQKNADEFGRNVECR